MNGELTAVLDVHGVSRCLRIADRAVPALAPISFTVHRGEFVVLAGPSGSGKTTLCAIVVGWDAPDTGTVVWHTSAAGWQRCRVAPQRLALVDHATVDDNLRLPAWAAGHGGSREAPGRPALGLTADAVAEVLDLESLLARRPRELSFGEQQRVAVGRALVGGSVLAVLDEPTGHQDEVHAGAVVTAIRAAAALGTAVLVASHDPLVLDAADAVVRLERPS